jgi:CheY-like chemotaxis protein
VGIKMAKTVMVVDDEADIIYTVKKALDRSEKKYKILGVESGEKCIELLENNQLPDLILLDIMMPGMNGWQVYDKLKENQEWREIPIFFLTARTDRVAVNAGRFLGDDYIEKPFDMKNLKSKVEKVLGG